MKVLYQVFESAVPREYKRYGIRALAATAQGWVCKVEIADITDNAAHAIWLAELCTCGELDPIHLQDVVDDTAGIFCPENLNL